MDLNIERLLDKFAENANEYLEKIHNDNKLTKRYCKTLDLYIANASKELFTPEEEWQLLAKGIVYKIIYHHSDHAIDGFEQQFQLISLPLTKIFNYEENQDVKTLANEMISIGAEPVYTQKLDGTSIARWVYKNKVYLSTRGMIETMAETPEQSQYFKWAREIAEKKYPLILDPEYLNAGTSVFELTGPDNQIVTHYQYWDLTMLSFTCLRGLLSIRFFEDKLAKEVVDAFNFKKIEYWPHDELVQYCEENNFAKPVNKLYTFGENLAEQIESINKLFSNTDEEGSVIQFEKTDERGIRYVVGRIKAKTDTYRQLLKLMNGCNYESISSLIRSDLQRFQNWETFELYLKSLGNANYPEELKASYQSLHEEFWKHRNNCSLFVTTINQDVTRIIDENNIDFEFGDNFEIIFGKKSRAKFAEHAKRHKFPGALFACVDAKLTTEYTIDKILKTPEDAKKAIEVLSK